MRFIIMIQFTTRYDERLWEVFPTKNFDKAETSTKLMSLLLQQGVEKIDRLRHGGFWGGACVFSCEERVRLYLVPAGCKDHQINSVFWKRSVFQ